MPNANDKNSTQESRQLNQSLNIQIKIQTHKSRSRQTNQDLDRQIKIQTHKSRSRHTNQDLDRHIKSRQTYQNLSGFEQTPH